MKKNYIAPSTQMATLASMGLMDGITYGINSTSCGTSIKETNDVNAID
jgi:hypothetical protein